MPVEPAQTWTDRLVDGARPAVRRSPAPREAAPAPAEFVPTGDRKLDALRRMLGQDTTAAPAPAEAPGSAAVEALPPWMRPEGTDAATAAPPSRRSDRRSSVRRSAAESAGGVEAARASRPAVGDASRADTFAGSSTAPGSLAERSRPQRTEPEASPAARPTAGAPGGRPGSSTPRRARRATPAKADRKLDALRRMLEGSELHPGNRSADRDERERGTGRPSPQPPAARGPSPAVGPSPTTTDAAARRTPALDAAPPTDSATPEHPGRSDDATDRSALDLPVSPPAVTGGDAQTSRQINATEGSGTTLQRTSTPAFTDGQGGQARVASTPRTPDRMARQQALRRAADPSAPAAVSPDAAVTPSTIEVAPGRAAALDSTRPPTVVPFGDGAPAAPTTHGRGPSPEVAPAEVRRSAEVPTGSVRDSVRPVAPFGREPRPEVATRGPVADRAVTRSSDRWDRDPAPRPIVRRRPSLADTPLLPRASLPTLIAESAADVDSVAALDMPVRPPAVDTAITDPITAGETASRGSVEAPTVRRSPPSAPPAVESEASLRRRLSLPRVLSRQHRPQVGPSTETDPVSVQRRVVAPPAARDAVPAQPPAATTPPPGRTPAPPTRTDTPVTAGTVARSIAPEPVPVEPPPLSLPERFERELTVRRSPAPSALPAPYQPLAQTIAPRRRVLLSTDSVSRRALRSVGKPAATVDDTIHLDPAAVTSQRMAEVMAHELTHVASPSPVARFFDDPDDSPEERRAEAVAAVIARSPVAPSASLVGRNRPASPPPSASAGDADTVRRSPARSTASSPSSGSTSSSGSVNAADLAARLTGQGDTVRRSPASPSSSSRSSSGSASSTDRDTVRRTIADDETSASMSQVTESHDPDAADRQFEAAFTRNLDRIVRLLQERLEGDRERHGGRFRRGF